MLWQACIGKRADLDKTPKHDGNVYWCYDDGSLHFDFLDFNGIVQRQQVNAKDAETLSGKTLEELKEYIQI